MVRQSTRRSPRSAFSKAADAAWTLLLVLFLLRLVEDFTGFPISYLGIVPRTLSGLIGILFSPLIHADWRHLLTNAAPLFILLTILYWDRHNYPERTLAMIWIASGFGTWLIGRPSIHVGASSIIFGLVAYLILAGVLAGRWRSFLVGIAVFLLFGGIFVGVIPQSGPVSWEGHLSGAIAGLWAAKRNYLAR